MPSEDEVTRQRLYDEAQSRVKTNQTGNGKFFLSTGAWFLTDKYVDSAKQRGCPECVYRLDERFAKCLAHLFKGSSVTELGAGIGRYKKYIESRGGVKTYTAYDGMPDAEGKSEGRVHHADLSTTDNTIVQSDWCLTLEVAEHIPPQFEANFLTNIQKAATKGLVISWSSFGKGQSNHGHVNAKSATQVHQLFESRGYTADGNASRALRRCATFPYHKRVHVFMRKPEQ